jgi:hypothetical protein
MVNPSKNNYAQNQIVAAIGALIVVIVLVYFTEVYLFPVFENLPRGNFISDYWPLILFLFGLCIIVGILGVLVAIARR